MQTILYPLVGILTISDGGFQATSASPELAIVLAGVLASAMIGAFYLGLPLSVLRGKVKHLAGTSVGKALERVLVLAALTSISALALGELTNSAPVLMIASATTVLSTMLLAATATSNRLSLVLARDKIR